MKSFIKKNDNCLIILFIALALVDRVLKIIYFDQSANSHVYAYKGVAIIVGILIFIVLRLKVVTSDGFKWFELMLIGGVSNLFDIICFGFVVDYIPIGIFRNNLSDILITIGFLFLILEVFNEDKRIHSK